MKLISAALLGGAMLPIVVSFAPSRQSSLVSPVLKQTNEDAKLSPSKQGSIMKETAYRTQLNMAFKTDQPSNMFDGPLAQTRERDACGVGFIANTQSGGK